MPTISLDIDIPAERERVFGEFLEPQSWERWVTAHAGWPDGLPELVEGTSFSQTMRFMRWTSDLTWTITELRAPSRIALDGSGPMGLRIRTLYELEPTAGGTNLQLTSDFSGGPASGAMSAIVTRRARSECQTSLSAFKMLLADEQRDQAADPSRAPRPARRLHRVRGRATPRRPVEEPGRSVPPLPDVIGYGLRPVRLWLRLVEPARAWRVAGRLARVVRQRS